MASENGRRDPARSTFQSWNTTDMRITIRSPTSCEAKWEIPPKKSSKSLLAVGSYFFPRRDDTDRGGR